MHIIPYSSKFLNQNYRFISHFYNKYRLNVIIGVVFLSSVHRKGESNEA